MGLHLLHDDRLDEFLPSGVHVLDFPSCSDLGSQFVKSIQVAMRQSFCSCSLRLLQLKLLQLRCHALGQIDSHLLQPTKVVQELDLFPRQK